MLTTNSTIKPIPKNQIGMNTTQKEILKSVIGKAPKLPVEINTVREWDKHGEETRL
ncbi:hypothetical protein QWJ34_03920 [Saccharibacillus sp. CPCC 101409]|uniref:hypothetical protein n=1 Tax=Saccharibacillus sp. CPCC 101409 TaxID=3058041 RepID=UPI002672C17D|nr:hypothetical protein [Saccharibacillus sp. CPCC 101409]MDO3408907.1 hypothetical protein [Saccharibacillus sp. CPCC 101409]